MKSTSSHFEAPESVRAVWSERFRIPVTFQPWLTSPILKPLGAMVVASVSGCGLLATRMFLTHQTRHLYLVWNLMLAWLPLLFALVILWRSEGGRRWNRGLTSAAIAWMLFFPNAPYICTDLVHLGPRTNQIFWADLVLILLFALTGLVLGFFSLFLMQTMVARRRGWPAGWGFAIAVAALSGFGIYLGRFQRWNSWDVLANPLGLLVDIGFWLLNIAHQPSTGIVPVLFAILVLLAYLMFFAMTHATNAIATLEGNEAR